MIRFAAWGLVSLGVLHLLVFGAEAIPEIKGWFKFTLWSGEHWLPFREQGQTVLVSGAAFWATLGSCAPGLIILGSLILWMEKRGLPIPTFVGWSLLVWLIVAALVMEFSGFIIAVPLAILLTIGLRRQFPGAP